ncbi:MAG TPA: T9SS type A sorting domain-containing protein [Flavobacteriia bacterium]|nr:T9SS type A sorting domain-containing protein [Flavobacteriia bacterium]
MSKKPITNLVFFIFKISVFAQSFAPQVGFENTTAIHKDSLVFVDWAKEITITRGYQNIENPNVGFVDFGTPEDALYQADGNPNIVSLGDGGIAILHFDEPIVNGDGPDFAVFENGFLKEPNSPLAFLELAFVEVSTDGIEYMRFPAISEITTTTQINSFGFIDARYIHNFAGKYIANYGTPFDLEDLFGLTENTTIDLNNIHYIKIIDVIGDINSDFATYDSQNTVVNDPFPTEFASGGFDLDAVGVLHNSENNAQNNHISVYPNPFSDQITIHSNRAEVMAVKLYSVNGKCLLNSKNDLTISTLNLEKGIYFLEVNTTLKTIVFKVVKI